MNVQDVLNKSLIYYDTGAEFISFLKKNTWHQGNKTDNDYKRSVFKFIDSKTDKVILETEVEMLAIYYSKYNVWSWAWSQPGLTNSENFLAKEILQYALKLGSDMSYIKNLITTSRGIIRDLTQIDINLAIGSSIIKQPYIYPFEYIMKDGNKLVYYIMLLNKEAIQNIIDSGVITNI